MRKSKNTTTIKGDRRVLVRADAITWLSADDHQVRASELGSDDVTVLADEKDGGPNGPLLPEGFNVDMLRMVSEMRRKLATNSEDYVLTAQVIDGAWTWRAFAVSEPEPKPSR
ncbi:hypothetical protein LRE75_33290 [Streptomyces sp. 372A]